MGFRPRSRLSIVREAAGVREAAEAREAAGQWRGDDRLRERTRRVSHAKLTLVPQEGALQFGARGGHR